VPRKPKPMSSKKVQLGLVAALSAAVLGYCTVQERREVTAYCVDPQSRQPDGSYLIVDEEHCHRGHSSSRTKVGFVWYYGGDVRNGRVSHGSTVRPRDVRIVSQKGHVIQRGGASASAPGPEADRDAPDAIGPP